MPYLNATLVACWSVMNDSVSLARWQHQAYVESPFNSHVCLLKYGDIIMSTGVGLTVEIAVAAKMVKLLMYELGLFARRPDGSA